MQDEKSVEKLKQLIKKVINILEKQFEGGIKVIDLKNYVYILEKLIIIIKKYNLNDERLLDIDHQIIQEFIDRYSKNAKIK